MPINSQNTILIEGVAVNLRGKPLKNGAYPPSLNPPPNQSGIGKKIPKPEDVADKECLIIWNRSGDPKMYPLMSEYEEMKKKIKEGKVDKNSEFRMDDLNGGFKMDLVYPPLATFGVYRRKRDNTWGNTAWFDFDHWPVQKIGKNEIHLLDSMADGHSHKRTQGFKARPLINNEPRLARAVAAVARGGQFLF